ncbi:MAG: SAM-dependent methyltransferase [Rhodobacteraceae bacterium]|nr:SAM-dependent methyltransferase [Paracoccaceae bacterium]
MLKEIIKAEIQKNGPIGVDRYMQLCLSHPEYGYYTQSQPFGKEGDFTTSPEISQMFGELVGLWLVQQWLTLGAPSPFALCELGPGRGTLMADILRVARLQPEFLSAAQIYLVENSPKLRATQKETLAGITFSHLENIEDLPEIPLILVANEFFDALPIQQFVRNDFGWQERLVDDSIALCLSKTRNIPSLEAAFGDVPTGTIVETNEATRNISGVITKRVATLGGSALVIDYGSFEGTGDTFQAVQKHQKTDPYAAPGMADLTAHVRFSDLVQNGVNYAITEQGAFLLELGIEARTEMLKRRGGDDIEMAKNRLIGNSEMGRLFKVLAISSHSLENTQGFQNAT